MLWHPGWESLPEEAKCEKHLNVIAKPERGHYVLNSSDVLTIWIFKLYPISFKPLLTVGVQRSDLWWQAPPSKWKAILESDLRKRKYLSSKGMEWKRQQCPDNYSKATGKTRIPANQATDTATCPAIASVPGWALYTHTGGVIPHSKQRAVYIDAHLCTEIKQLQQCVKNSFLF